jgi:hypothetical protein
MLLRPFYSATELEPLICYSTQNDMGRILFCLLCVFSLHSYALLGGFFNEQSRGSSVSIVSGYGLDEGAIEVRSPAEAKGFVL